MLRLVAGNHNIKVWIGFNERFQALLHLIDHGDGITATLFANADNNRFLSIQTREAFAGLKAIHHFGHVAQIDGRATCGDDHIANVVQRLKITRRAQGDFLFTLHQGAAGDTDIFGLQRAAYLLRGNFACLQGFNV